MSTPLKVVFAGTPDFAARHLQGLIDSPHQIVAVMSQPDRPAGRGKRLQPTPVKAVALEAELPVWQPVSLKNADGEATLSQYHADILVVVAYGLILPAAIWISLGWVASMFTPLITPVARCRTGPARIEAGDTETGVSIMAMEPGLDTGPVLLTRTLPISTDHSSGTLLDDLAQLGVTALSTVLRTSHLLATAAPQDDSEATYAHKISKQEGALDWSAAAALARRVRAFHPAPGCYTHLGGDRLKVLSAHAVDESHEGRCGEIIAADERGIRVGCGEGQLVITEAQLPGAKAQSVVTLLRGHQARFHPGQRLGDADPH